MNLAASADSVNTTQLMVCPSSQLSVDHAHDYIKNVRGGHVKELLDNMSKACPEFQDFLHDYKMAKHAEDRLHVIELKCQYVSWFGETRC